VRQVHAFLWGIAGYGVVRIGCNENSYTLGNRWGVNTWVKKQIASWLQAYVQLNGLDWGNIRGADPALDPTLVPTADPDRQAGRRIDLLVGTKLSGHNGVIKNQHLEIMFGVPIYQHLDGPQLKTRWMASVQWVLAV